MKVINKLFSFTLFSMGLFVAVSMIIASCTKKEQVTPNPLLTDVALNGACGNAPNGYPYCCNASSDPDGDGWGWENNASCFVNKNTNPCGTAPNGYPFCCNASSDPDGDGWGWENNKSCVVNRGSGGGGGGGAVGCPSSLTCPSGMQCGCYTEPGLGANKQAFLNAGANVEFLASAMMETNKMNTNYPYGDNKTQDAFNAGAAKQNWGMMRAAHPAWRNLGPNNYNTGAQLNNNRGLDVVVYKETRAFYGEYRFLAGHRNGATGLNNPNTPDINGFRAAYYWTRDRINSNGAYRTNDVRFWVSVRAI